MAIDNVYDGNTDDDGSDDLDDDHDDAEKEHPWQGTRKVIIMIADDADKDDDYLSLIMMMLRKSILVSPWQASPGAVNLLLVHYNVFQHTDDEQCHIFLLLSFMLILASGEYEWRRRKQWDYWIFCELGQRRWYDEIIWLANPGSWPGGEYNQQKLYKVIRGKKTKWTKNKEMNPMCHNKKTKKVFGGEAVWALNLILQNTAFSSHWSRAGLLWDRLVGWVFVCSSPW